METLKEGLIEEARRIKYIDDSWITEENINAFLDKVTFVVDDKTKVDYIRGIMNINPKYIPQDSVLDGIFNRIRDVQAAKKNNASVEGETVSHLREVLYFDRVLRVKEIRLMVLNSLINRDVMNTPPPHSFYKLLERFDGLKQRDVVEECKLQIALLLYDKTYNEDFWKLLELIYETIETNNSMSEIQIFNLIENMSPVNNPRLDALTVQYLICLMKEALQ